MMLVQEMPLHVCWTSLSNIKASMHTFLSGLYRRLNKSRMCPMMKRMVQLRSNKECRSQPP